MRDAAPPRPRLGILADDAFLRGPLESRQAHAQAAVEAGVSHVFVSDHVSFHTGWGSDGLIKATLAAQLDPRLGVSVGVYLLALRHPTPVARQIATLCEAAPGQLELGVGVGGEDRHEMEVCGVDPATRGRRTDEHLEVLRALLSGEPVTYDGEFVQLEDALIRPAPDPAVPLVVGGRSEKALQRAGRLGDGWLGIWATPERYRDAVAKVGEAAAEAGRASTCRRHGLQLWAGVAAPGERLEMARERLAARMQSMYRIPFERFERYSPVGEAQAIADRLLPYAAAGCSAFNLCLIGAGPEEILAAAAQIRRVLDG